MKSLFQGSKEVTEAGMELQIPSLELTLLHQQGIPGEGSHNPFSTVLVPARCSGKEAQAASLACLALKHIFDPLKS